MPSAPVQGQLLQRGQAVGHSGHIACVKFDQTQHPQSAAHFSQSQYKLVFVSFLVWDLALRWFEDVIQLCQIRKQLQDSDILLYTAGGYSDTDHSTSQRKPALRSPPLRTCVTKFVLAVRNKQKFKIQPQHY